MIVLDIRMNFLYSVLTSSEFWDSKTNLLIIPLLGVVWFKIVLPNMEVTPWQSKLSFSSAIVIITLLAAWDWDRVPMLAVFCTNISLNILIISLGYWAAKCLVETVLLPWGPYGVPVLGYLPWICPRAPYLTFCRLADRYGPYYTVKMGGIHTLVLSDVGMIRDIYKSPLFDDRPDLYLTHGIMGNRGVIGARYAHWVHI